MKPVIYKYPFEITDEFELELPKGAHILNFDNQHETPALWCEVDPDAETETRKFLLVGTGHPIKYPKEKRIHLGTVQFQNGHFVGHLFEIIK